MPQTLSYNNNDNRTGLNLSYQQFKNTEEMGDFLSSFVNYIWNLTEHINHLNEDEGIFLLHTYSNQVYEPRNQVLFI